MHKQHCGIWSNHPRTLQAKSPRSLDLRHQDRLKNSYVTNRKRLCSSGDSHAIIFIRHAEFRKTILEIHSPAHRPFQKWGSGRVSEGRFKRRSPSIQCLLSSHLDTHRKAPKSRGHINQHDLSRRLEGPDNLLHVRSLPHSWPFRGVY